MREFIEFREERDLGQKLNATMSFLRQNAKPLARCMLWYVVPFALLAGIFSGIYQSTQLELGTGQVRYDTFGAYAFASSVNSVHYWVSMFFSLVTVVLLGLTVYCYMLEYMEHGGEVPPPAVWEGIKQHFIPLLYSSVGVVMICGLATLLLVLPGIYVSVALSLFMIVLLHEELSFVEALERCFFLVKGYWWSTFGFLVLVLLVQGVVGFAASLPAIVIYVLRILQLPGGESDVLLLVATSVTTILSLLLYVISITATAFQYFDLVEKKEGIGLLAKVNQIGARPGQVLSPDQA